MKKYFNNLCCLFALALVMSCSETLDINTDPNNPTDVAINQLLPTAMVDLAGMLGSSVGGAGNFSSMYIHHTVQRGISQNDYAFNGNDFGVTIPWDIFYPRALTDLNRIIIKAGEIGSDNYAGIAKIMKAYGFSVLVDLYGDIPYSESGDPVGFVFPNFDDDAAIYPQLFALLDEGIANLNAGAGMSPGTDDLLYGGNTQNWIKFANTLKLKMYTQVRNVQDVSSQVSGLLSGGQLIGPGEDLDMQYGTNVNPTDRNPGYAQEWAAGGARNNISPYFYEIMSGLNTFHSNEIYLDAQAPMKDPRIPYYFYNQLATAEDDAAENPCAYCPSVTSTPFLSIYMFSFNIDPNEGFDQSSSQTVMGLYPLGGKYDDGSAAVVNLNGNPATPQRLLGYYDRLFLEAELIQAGVISGDVDAVYESAVRAAFAKVNELASSAGAPAIEAESIDAYIAFIMPKFTADGVDKMEHIMTQKWIANFGKGFDAYTDYRRTGFPTLHDGDTDNLTVTDQQRAYARSYPWPQSSELDVNGNSPEQKIVADYRVFWDVN